MTPHGEARNEDPACHVVPAAGSCRPAFSQEKDAEKDADAEQEVKQTERTVERRAERVRREVQQGGTDEKKEAGEDEASAAEREGDGAAESVVERIRRATRLPGAAERAREAGVPEEEIRKVLKTGRARRVPAADMKTVLEEESRASEEHGHIDNFGSFVQSKLDEGLRGRELAEAIHREHAARGKGKHRGTAKAKGKSEHGEDHEDDHAKKPRKANAKDRDGDEPEKHRREVSKPDTEPESRGKKGDGGSRRPGEND